MFSKITKLNDYDKITLIYEPTVQAKKQKNKVLVYLIFLVLIAIFLLGVNFAFHFLRQTALVPPSPNKSQQFKVYNIKSIDSHGCPKVDFDYIQLTIRWPPSYCNYKQCRKGVKMYNWNIHGLWPDFINGSYPQFCCPNYKLNIDKLKLIQPELEMNWQDLTNNDTINSLWNHEWLKHGTCTIISPKIGSVFNYFNVTLELFKKYNVQTWLEEDDILPTSTKSYKLARILNVIESRLGGKRIKIECDKYTHEKENCDNADYSHGRAENCTKIKSKTFKLLDSIDLCFDKLNLLPINCPKSKEVRKNTCDNDVYYLRLKEELENLEF